MIQWFSKITKNRHKNEPQQWDFTFLNSFFKKKIFFIFSERKCSLAWENSKPYCWKTWNPTVDKTSGDPTIITFSVCDVDCLMGFHFFIKVYIFYKKLSLSIKHTQFWCFFVYFLFLFKIVWLLLTLNWSVSRKVQV